ncbi:MAG: MFS transporter [Geothrix sp.]|uniref:MFS transporter n=1 Tax=Geothrix sp. TaxID=1962974 RepID=UPI00180F8D4E|nr:MFS transporter [Geothrix sp.]NWJ39507.1 MFS transporter [Geothrix sp.]WIL19270.1 MAG: MFS transporter [Geothrix sp.]
MTDAKSPFAPLRSHLFLAIWIAAMASNVGTWVQSVGEKWLMAEITRSPLLMSLIETGSTLPMLILSMPGGAIADIVDRRRLLLTTQAWMLLAASAMAIFSALHLVTPGLLITMSLLLGVGAALNAPAWQASVPDLVPKDQIAAGVALNSAGFNVSRAVGPALGGLVVGWLGPTWAFALNAVSFVGVLVVLKGWKRQPVTTDLPAERFSAAMKVGLRYTRHRKELQVILVRGGSFVFFGGPIFSLLPTLAIHHLNLGSSAFGLLLGCVGVGAVASTLALPTLRAKVTPNQLLALATAIFATGLLVLAFVVRVIPVALVLLVCGGGWLTVLSTCNTGVQLSVPSWVRARALGVYITVWGGAMAGGAAFWGWVGEHWGIHTAFAWAGVGMFLMLALTARLKIQALHEPMDLSPHRQQAHAPEPIHPDEGPILTVLEYRVPEERKAAFQEAMREVRRIRIRDGAVRWSLFHDLAPPEPGQLRFVESFLSSSWGEHLRQHHRATVEDRAVFRRAYALGIEAKPRIRHLVGAWEDRDSLLDRIFE